MCPRFDSGSCHHFYSIRDGQTVVAHNRLAEAHDNLGNALRRTPGRLDEAVTRQSGAIGSPRVDGRFARDVVPCKLRPL